MEGIVAIVMVFSIPLAAILTSFYYKLQKLKLENGSGGKQAEDLRREMDYLLSENEMLKERLEQMEQRMEQSQERYPLDEDRIKEPVRLFREPPHKE